jgi:hypothetical protein
MKREVLNAIIRRSYKLFLSILQIYDIHIWRKLQPEIFNFSEGFFSGHQACIYAHSIFVE